MTFYTFSGRLMYVPLVSCVQGYLNGGFGTLYTPEVELFVMIASHWLFLQKAPSWVFGRVKWASVVLYYFWSVTMAWKVYCLFHLISSLLILCLHCYYIIQLTWFHQCTKIRVFFNHILFQKGYFVSILRIISNNNNAFGNNALGRIQTPVGRMVRFLR